MTSTPETRYARTADGTHVAYQVHGDGPITGDGVFAAFDGPARAIRCASTVRQVIQELDPAVRVGLHAGECERVDGGLRGVAVHVGARIGTAAQPGEILVSSTVRDLVAGCGIGFEDAGVHSLKGVPDEWRLSRVASV